MLALSSCISEYSNPAVVGSEALVVEGIIEEGETVIRLSKSVGVEETVDITIYVSDAEVSVEGSDGSVWKSAKADYLGHYRINIDKLLPDVQYRVKIVLDGDEYVSEYAKPIVSQDLGSMFWRFKQNDDKKVEICLNNAVKSGSETNYYLWKYSETYEVRSKIQARGYTFDSIGNKWYVEYDLTNYYDNIYYCWSGKQSSGIAVNHIEDISADSILMSIVEHDRSDDCFSVLYSINVTQYQITQSAHEYFSNVLDNSENVGDMFAPMPASISSNVQCVGNSKKRVIGYVPVSIPASKRIFIWRHEGIYTPPWVDCPVEASTDPNHDQYLAELYTGDWRCFAVDEMLMYSYSLTRCIDCTLKGSKSKPSWWPNTIGYE
jgi:hypothetical protein